jgi:hypothetical protein
LEVATDTAWLMLTIDATALAAPGKLRCQLADCLRFADNLIDEVPWSRPTLQLDALLNRRVGIQIVRLGEYLKLQGLVPGQMATFVHLKRWLRFVRHCIVRESAALARGRGPFPELGADQLIAELAPRYGVQNAHQLVRNRFLRHRHLLAISPYALFPDEPDPARDEASIDLLPAIRVADAITMYGPDVRSRLSLEAWRKLLEMTGAQANGQPNSD